MTGQRNLGIGAGPGLALRAALSLLLFGLVALPPAAAAESETASDAMKRLRDVARRGDVAGFQAFVHPKKGVKAETGRVKRKHVTQDWMLGAEFLKTARREAPAKCTEFKRGKALCTIHLGKSGGHSFHLARTKSGTFLMKARIFDG